MPVSRTVPRRLPALAAAAGAALLAVVLVFGVNQFAFASTLFGDDFEDGNTSGWSKSGGTWTVVTDGSRALQQSKVSTDNARMFAGSTSWTDVTVQARVKPLSLPGNGFVGLLARAAGSTTFYRLALLPGNTVQLQVVRSGMVTVLGSVGRTVATGSWYTLAVTVSGSNISGYVDGTLVASGVSSAVAAGRIGLQTGYATADFDDVTVTTGTTTPPTTAPPTASSSASPSKSPSASPSTSPSASVPAGSVVVARDGSGNYTTVQAAINSVPSGNSSRVTIVVKAGTYKEIVSIPSDKPYITLVGQTGNAKDVVITYDNANGTTKPDGTTYGTSGSASVTIDGHDFIAKNLTFSNSFDEAAHPEITNQQAVAVLTRTDRLTFDNVRFLGNQDTLYLNSASTAAIGRAYLRNCYIEGDVDFIFGRGTGVFDHCEIHSLNRGSTTNNGYVTAASTTDTNPYGLLFSHCNLTSDAPAASVYLGRPWHPSGDVHAIAQVVYRESTIGAHIGPSPWTDMSGFSWKDARFFEYHNTGAGATVTADRPQLTDTQAAALTPQAYLAGSDGWNPVH